jgi:hypothetical protein
MQYDEDNWDLLQHIYDLRLAGKSLDEIASELDMDVNNVVAVVNRAHPMSLLFIADKRPLCAARIEYLIASYCGLATDGDLLAARFVLDLLHFQNHL